MGTQPFDMGAPLLGSQCSQITEYFETKPETKPKIGLYFLTSLHAFSYHTCIRLHSGLCLTFYPPFTTFFFPVASPKRVLCVTDLLTEKLRDTQK